MLLTCIETYATGTPGHAVVPLLNKALQQWSGLTGKQVNYIMKGQNCETIMYSALSADVPIESDSGTYADNELVSKLHAAERVIICGEALSHAVNYTTRDLMRLMCLYEQQFINHSEESDLNSSVISDRMYLLKDCKCVIHL